MAFSSMAQSHQNIDYQSIDTNQWLRTTPHITSYKPRATKYQVHSPYYKYSIYSVVYKSHS